MKQLTDKEMVLLGSIGFLLEDDTVRWGAIRKYLIHNGYEEFINAYYEKNVDREDLVEYTNQHLYEIAMDLLKENGVE